LLHALDFAHRLRLPPSLSQQQPINLEFFNSSLLLQELSVELDGRREEQTGLAASGQRLINSLSDGSSSSHGGSSGNGGGGSGGGVSNDDALMLRRRLDDMNRRWHGLRAKTVAIRYGFLFCH